LWLAYVIGTLALSVAGCSDNKGGEQPTAESASVADIAAGVPRVSFREGEMPGVRVWQLPDAPGGTKPDQSWLAVGSDPNGIIYVSGHDHQLNSMLYRLDPETGSLEWVGDARTASTAADNWEPGETAEKFHTRPTYHDGRVYVATLDKSSIDDAFLSTRGFHWYAYDLASGDFVDLSADEPGGVGAEHLQVVTIQADPVNDRLYGMTIPGNQLLYYDVAQGRTTVVGTPDDWQGYFYSNRFIWTDSRGSVYMTGGTERSQWNQGEERSVLDSVWRYRPDSGFEDTGFALQTLAAIEVGQWNSAHDTLYVSDDMGHIYRFTDATVTWEYLGRPDFPAGETSSGFNKVWVFQLDPDEETIYLGRSDNSGRPNEIWEFDIDTRSSSILAVLPDLDGPAGREAFIAGYDSWDGEGNFYIASFSMYDSENAYLIGLNPVQIRSSNMATTAPASPEMLALAAEVEDALDHVAGEDYWDPRLLLAPDAVFVNPTGDEVQADKLVPADWGLDESWDRDGDGTVTFGDYIFATNEWMTLIATEWIVVCEPDGSEIVCRSQDQDVFGAAAGLSAARHRQARLTFGNGMAVRWVSEVEEETDWESWLEQFAEYERWVADVHPDVYPIVFRSPCCAGDLGGMWFTVESFEAQRSLVPEWAESVGVAYGSS
jgi:outer membrane protein assembly factor BamB